MLVSSRLEALECFAKRTGLYSVSSVDVGARNTMAVKTATPSQGTVAVTHSLATSAYLVLYRDDLRPCTAEIKSNPDR